MKFIDLKKDDWFKFREDGPSLQKTSDFGYTDPENKILGEQQIVFLSAEVIVP
jgi:hypothetical protein